MSSRQKGGNSRKIGRNKVKCARYSLLNKRIRNKVRKLSKYCKSHLNDKQTQARLNELQ